LRFDSTKSRKIWSSKDLYKSSKEYLNALLCAFCAFSILIKHSETLTHYRPFYH